MLFPLSRPLRTDNILAKRSRVAYSVRAAPGVTALAAHRWYRFKQRYQLGDVITVAARRRQQVMPDPKSR